MDAPEDVREILYQHSVLCQTCMPYRDPGDERIAARLKDCGLELHPEKTKIVYCKDDERRRTYPNEKFDFLGYTFRPRRSKNRRGTFFINFSPAVSDKAVKAIRAEIRGWDLHLRSDKRIEDLSRMFNPRSTSGKMSFRRDSGRHFIGFPGRLSAAPLNDLVESFEIGPRLPIQEEPRGRESRNLFRHRRGHELVNTRTVLAAQPLDRPL
jgi:hypothetical protein